MILFVTWCYTSIFVIMVYCIVSTNASGLSNFRVDKTVHFLGGFSPLGYTRLWKTALLNGHGVLLLWTRTESVPFKCKAQLETKSFQFKCRVVYMTPPPPPSTKTLQMQGYWGVVVFPQLKYWVVSVWECMMDEVVVCLFYNCKVFNVPRELFVLPSVI